MKRIKVSKDCEKLILEHAKNQINIENSRNNINNLTGINLSNLNINNNQNTNNNTYQNILANSQILNESILNNSILSSSLLNRTINPSLGLNNNLNLPGFNGLNNISNINPIIPTTPRRENSLLSPNLLNSNNFNNTFSSNISDYKIIRTNNFQ